MKYKFWQRIKVTDEKSFYYNCRGNVYAYENSVKTTDPIYGTDKGTYLVLINQSSDNKDIDTKATFTEDQLSDKFY